MQQTDNKKVRRKSSLDLGTMVYGKVPPQAKDLEEAILGAIMVQAGAIDTVSEWLKPEVFYVEAHQRIFNAMLSLLMKSQPVDILTVAEQLRSTEELEIVGGAYYVTKLTNSVVSAANIEAHSKIIIQKFVQREVIRIGGLMIAEAYEDSADIFDLLENAENNLFAITKALQNNDFKQVDHLLVKAIQEIEKMRHEEEKLSGVTSGFPSIDKKTHGWQNTDLIILAARPAVGKTAFALNLAINAVKAGTPTALFSLEMSAGQLIRRAMSSESEIPLEKIQRARLDDPDMERLYKKAIQPLAQKKIFIDDTSGISVWELRAKARRLKNKHYIGLIIIDYLQLMSGSGNNKHGNREQEISEISRNLKKIAKDLDIPVIALSQLSRQTENRTNKKPQLSDLRESGAIEQDADAVIFMYRPEYYGIQKDATGESTSGETEFNFAKYRNGSPGICKLRAQLWIQKFVEMDDAFPVAEKVNGVSQSWTPGKEQVDKTDKTFQ